MGCNSSHLNLRPFFRRCRRRSKKAEGQVCCKDVIDSNHHDSNNSEFLHGIQLIGSSVRNPINKSSDPLTSDSPFCVPLLAQTEASASQVDFFKLLDEKIEEGPDYDPEDDEHPNYYRPVPGIHKGGFQRLVLDVTMSGPSAGKSSTTKHNSRVQWEDD